MVDTLYVFSFIVAIKEPIRLLFNLLLDQQSICAGLNQTAFICKND